MMVRIVGGQLPLIAVRQTYISVLGRLESGLTVLEIGYVLASPNLDHSVSQSNSWTVPHRCRSRRCQPGATARIRQRRQRDESFFLIEKEKVEYLTLHAGWTRWRLELQPFGPSLPSPGSFARAVAAQSRVKLKARPVVVGRREGCVTVDRDGAWPSWMAIPRHGNVQARLLFVKHVKSGSRRSPE